MAVFKGLKIGRQVEESGAVISRVQFLLDEKADFTHFFLDNPPRVVIDFPAVTNLPDNLEIGDFLLKRVRFGRPAAGVLRAVLDLGRTQPYRIVEGEAPFSVTVEISRTRLNLLHDGKLLSLELEEYLAGVVAAEMPAQFHEEALKAQAVASRTYAARKMLVYGGSGCSRNPEADVCSDPAHCQGWQDWQVLQERWGADFARFREKVLKAVESTRLQVLMYGGRPAEAVFHSTCGGRTESAANVWGNDIPYLQAVECPYDSHSPHYRTERIISVAELLKRAGVESDVLFPCNSDGRPVLSREDVTLSGTVKKMELEGKTTSGMEMRRLLELPSPRFSVEVPQVKVVSRGFGHGVGLCQYGADGWAKHNADWQSILMTYYPGVQIKPLEGNQGEDLPEIPHPQGVLVAIDPGHGGESPGAVGPTGLREKDVVLEISGMLAGMLKKAGARVLLTRETDQTVTLEKRVKLANEAKADLFVSIHVNGHSNSQANGTETYHYPESAAGLKLAGAVQKNMIALLKRRDRGVKPASFYVLRYANMPAALAEIAFITNQEEEALLKDAAFKEKAAQAIMQGIFEYLGHARKKRGQ